MLFSAYWCKSVQWQNNDPQLDSPVSWPPFYDTKAFSEPRGSWAQQPITQVLLTVSSSQHRDSWGSPLCHKEGIGKMKSGEEPWSN